MTGELFAVDATQISFRASQSVVLAWCIYKITCFPATDTLAARTSRDYLLGTVTVPTRDLLRRRSGNAAVLRYQCSVYMLL